MMNFLINGVEKARLIFDERKCKNLSNKIKKIEILRNCLLVILIGNLESISI